MWRSWFPTPTHRGSSGPLPLAVSKHNSEGDQNLTPPPSSSIGRAGHNFRGHRLQKPGVCHEHDAEANPNSRSLAQLRSEEFAALFPPGRELSYILGKLRESIRTGKPFHLCRLKDQARTAVHLEGINGLTITEKLQFCLAPLGRDPSIIEALVEMARCVAENRNGGILEVKALDLEIQDIEIQSAMRFLAQLEVLHESILLWLWLS